MEDDEIALGTSAERAGPSTQLGKAGCRPYLVESKRHAFIWRGQIRLGHGDSAPAFRVLEAHSSSGVCRAGHDKREGDGN
jgi:hypothetical protein